MRYLITFFVCAILSVGGVVIWLTHIIPPGEGAFGIAKMVPLILLIVPPAVFSLVWFPANLIVFLLHRREQRIPPPSVLSTSAVAMIMCLCVIAFCLYRAAPAWLSERREQKLDSVASQSKIELRRVKGLIDQYAAESNRGTQPQPPSGKYRAIRTLIDNPATPPDVLTYLADKMDDASPVLFFIAEKSNCPPALIVRFSSIPGVLPYLAKNIQAPPELLVSLAHSPDWHVRDAVAMNPETPRSILDLLTNDPKWTVQDSAARSIKIRFGQQTGH